MALSDEEQRLLAQLEQALAADDPRLAQVMRGRGTRKIHRRRASLASLVFVLGMTALIAGIRVHPALSLVGFALMLGAAIIGINSWSHVNDDEPGTRPSQTKASPNSDPSEQVRDFMEKMEDRWKRRQNGGL